MPDAAGLLNVGRNTVQRARVVQEKGIPELIAAVDAGEISVSKAAQLAPEPEYIQRSAVRAMIDADATDLLALASEQRYRKERETRGQSVLQSTSNEWYTPSKYIDAAHGVMGAIDLDPASCDEANEIVKAETYYTARDDGLSQSWFGRVWLNPPYGGLAEEFVARLVRDYDAGVIRAGIALVNAHCTDTRWFRPLWDHVLCFTDHRIDFSASKPRSSILSTSTHGSVFAYFGPDPTAFAHEFAQFGAIVRRWPWGT